MGMAEHYEGGVEWYPNQTERSYFKSYLKRGEYEKAMLVLYCNLTYGMSGDTYQTSERFHTDSENFCAYAPNASGNGRNIELMRRMVIDEQDAGKLWLLRGCPRRWFTDGQSITIENATTLFGKMAIRTRVEGKTITIEVESPDRETPEEMILVVRVPQGTAIADATLDGVPTSFDGDQIVLPKRHGQFTVKVRYADR
jgi:hypothetical protein